MVPPLQLTARLSSQTIRYEKGRSKMVDLWGGTIYTCAYTVYTSDIYMNPSNLI